MNAPLVVKIGGEIINNPEAITELLGVVKALHSQNKAVVIVHGGGCVVDEMLAQAQFTSNKINGLRVTDAKHMPIVAGALAGVVNKTLVAHANNQGLSAVGLSLVDGNSVQCQKAASELGAVGIPVKGDNKLINSLIEHGHVVIISSIGNLADSSLVNVNADDAAVAISDLIDGDLVLLTDVAGVKGAQGTYLAELAQEHALQLIADGIINGGMVAKVNAAFTAANRLRRSIAVASWKTPEQLIGLSQGELLGTRIQPK